MNYDSLDAFVADLPTITAPLRDKLRDHDGLFLLETERRKAYVRLSDGAVSVEEQEEEYPVCIIHAEEDILMDMICGRLNPMKALLFSKVTVQGDVKPLLRLCALL